jgi:hypothetical protein
MIDDVIERWHLYLRGDLPGGLDSLLADEVVFFSPVVFTPQKGKEITSLYLSAAAGTFSEPTDSGSDVGASDGDTTSGSGGQFKYVKETTGGNTAMLEFETQMGGKFVNGVDIITCNDDGQIIEFKVLVRPLQAVNAVHEAMGAMLDQMQRDNG